MQRTQEHSKRRRRFAAAVLSLGLIGAGFALAPSAQALDDEDFRPLPQPKRVLETRGAPFDTIPDGATKPAADSVTQVKVTGGDTGVPADATAVSVTVTGVESAADDNFLTVWDCTDDPTNLISAEPDPPLASNVNLRTNDIRPNAVISKVGTAEGFEGEICIYARRATHLLVDINGYFPDGASPTHLTLEAPPERIFDTRPESRVNYLAGKPQAGQVLYVPVGNTTEAQILNVTGVNATAAGWLTVWDCKDEKPADGPDLTEPDQPNVSALNLHPGIIAANLVITRADGGAVPFTDMVCIYTSHGTDVVVDKIGTFPVTSDFDLVDPKRILETRGAPLGPIPANAGKFPGGVQVALNLADHVVADTRAVAINVTGTDSANGYVTVYPCLSHTDPAPAERPNASNLNLVAGQTRPNTVITAIGATDRICIFTQHATHLVIDLVGQFNQHPAPVTTSSSTTTTEAP